MRRCVEYIALLLFAVLGGTAWAQNAPSVKVRGGEHPAFGRVVIDWTRSVDYTVRRDGDRAVVQFDAPARFDLGAVAGQTFGPVLSVKNGPETEESSAVEIELPPGTTHRHFRDGTKIAVDFFPPEARRPAVVPPREEKAAPAKLLPDGAKPGALVERGPAAPSASPPATPEKASPASLRPTAAKPAAASQQKPAARGAAGPVVAGLDLIPGGGVRLRLPTPEGIGAAVFERAGRHWIVLGSPLTVDLAALGAGGGGPIAEARQLPHADAGVVVIKTKGALTATASRRDGAWLVDLKEAASSVGAKPLGIAAEPFHPSGPRVVMPTAGASPPVELRDPDVGDRIVVVPLDRPGIGVPLRREYPQFTILPAAQGVAVAPKADSIKVQSSADAIVIRAEGELQIAGAYPDGRAPPGTTAPAAQAMPFRSWAGPPGEFQATKKMLQDEVARADPKSIAAKRLALARFYFANNETVEGYGVLSRAVQASPSLIEDPRVRVLRAAMLTELGRYPGAEADLSRPELIGDGEAALWRGRAAAGRGDTTGAIREFRRGESSLRLYPPDRQAAFLLAEAGAHLGSGDAAAARKALEKIDTAIIPPRYAAEKAYLSGRADTLLGDRAGARKAFEAAIASGHRPVEYRSRLAVIEDRLAQKEIDRPQAIQEMDRLRIGWRGDDFEPELLRRIGALKIDNGDWRDGFDAYRQAATLFAKTPYAKAIAEDLSAAFERLFLKGEAEKLPAVEALAIYYDFRELTPTGSKGDEMIRHLADRLAAVDLLDQAASLIEHQAKFRVKGEEQAKLSNRLAILRLLDRQPEKALQALELAAGQPVSPELARERVLLEARAQGDLGRFDAARKTIATATGPEADALRFELASRAKDWPEAATIAGRIVESTLAEGDKPDAGGRRAILRWATALALSGDEDALQKLRGRFAAAFEGTPETDTFLVLTSRVDRNQQAFQAVVKKVAGVDQLEAFMSAYRERLKSGGLSAIN